MEELPNIEDEYKNHKIFEQLTHFKDFYETLSHSTSPIMSQGTDGIQNLNTLTFSSIECTLDSIQKLLVIGRINDSYALLRKYFDSTIINIYTNLYLDDHFSSDNLTVEQINDWKLGKKRLPEFRIISRYIKESAKLKKITDLLSKDDLYKKIRDRCNDHTHYNYYYNVLLNDKRILLTNSIKLLDTFYIDLNAIFIQHFSYLFYFHDYLMMSSDYLDYLEEGLTPERDSQYLVSPSIQETFDKWIKPNRPDIADALKAKTAMHLE